MNAVGRWQAENELDDEQLAALLSERLGRKITAHGVHTMSRRRNPPQTWLDALELSPQDPDSPNDAAPPPKPPADKDLVGLPFEPIAARTQIALMYTAAGKGAALVLHSPPVADVWAQHAPGIADAYIEWAKHNKTVAGIIATATLGGPAGQVVLLHGSLVVSTLIVSGRFDPNRLVPPGMREPEPTHEQPSPFDFTEPPPDGDPNAAAEPPPANGVRRGERPVRRVD